MSIKPIEFPGCLDNKKALIGSGNKKTNSPKMSGISGVFREEKTLFGSGNNKTNSPKMMEFSECLEKKKH